MKSLAFLEQVAHDRKAAMYAAQHDSKVRNFVYLEGLGECRETFSRLLQDVQKGEIGVILTPDAACLAIETAPGWMEAFIQAVKQHEVLIGDHSHDLVYDLRDEEDEAQFRSLSPQGEYEQARSALLDAIAQSPFAGAYVVRGGAGKSSWISSPPMALARRGAGARFRRNAKTGSPARSSKRTPWLRKQPPR